MPNPMTTHRPYPAEQIADYILWFCNENEIPVSNKKLQKLLYYSQAWNLVFQKRPLFKEKLEAWVHGPTVARVYGKFKEFGFEKINIKVDGSIQKTLSKSDLDVLNEVLAVYGKFDADYLEALTHSEQPWLEARAGLEAWDSSNNAINLETMERYYRQKYEQNKQ